MSFVVHALFCEVASLSMYHLAVRACSKDGRPEIYLKREDLNHTGAHKINNSLGQALLCMRMGKKRVIAETGAGQHGVATVSSLLAGMLSCMLNYVL